MSPIPQPSRRQVIKGAGLVAAAGAVVPLAGCGSEGVEQGSGPAAAPGPTVEVPKDKVPVGSGVVLEQDYVVTQPVAGQYKAFGNICPHQGCAVSFVRGNAIVCACHGSDFSIEDGSVMAGPARNGLPTAPVADQGDNLVIN